VEVDRNVELVEVAAGEEVELGGAGGPRVQACAVPHRGEYSDTVAYFVEGLAGRRLFYCPDIDSWDEWDRELSQVCDSVDVQLVDATFFSAKELPGRDTSKIPHPFITTTAARLPDLEQRRKTVLIHLNHSNPVYLEGSAEREWCLEQGFQIGRQGMSWHL
jgi:pyrroloquinoline quinone biosynthesis protein B